MEPHVIISLIAGIFELAFIALLIFIGVKIGQRMSKKQKNNVENNKNISNKNFAATLQELKESFENGTITQEEYDEKRKELLKRI